MADSSTDADTGGKTDDDGGKGFAPPQSQADLDRIINDRLAREKAKFADYGDLKAKASRLDQIEAANATDLEKAVKAARTEGETEATTRANTRLVKSEARALAAVAQFRDPADAVAFLDLSEVKVDDSGEVDVASVKRLLDGLAATKPYLLVAPDDGKPRGDVAQGPRGTAGASGGTPADDFATFITGQLGR